MILKRLTIGSSFLLLLRLCSVQRFSLFTWFAMELFNDEYYIKRDLQEAEQAFSEGEIPVGRSWYRKTALLPECITSPKH